MILPNFAKSSPSHEASVTQEATDTEKTTEAMDDTKEKAAGLNDDLPDYDP